MHVHLIASYICLKPRHRIYDKFSKKKIWKLMAIDVTKCRKESGCYSEEPREAFCRIGCLELQDESEFQQLKALIRFFCDTNQHNKSNLVPKEKLLKDRKIYLPRCQHKNFDEESRGIYFYYLPTGEPYYIGIAGQKGRRRNGRPTAGRSLVDRLTEEYNSQPSKKLRDGERGWQRKYEKYALPVWANKKSYRLSRKKCFSFRDIPLCMFVLGEPNQKGSELRKNVEKALIVALLPQGNDQCHPLRHQKTGCEATEEDGCKCFAAITWSPKLKRKK